MRGLIEAKMTYWFNRMILGWASQDSVPGLDRRQLRVLWGRWRRRRYAALRASGLSPYETTARMQGISAEEARTRNIMRHRRYRARLGGDPSIGSRAWVEREVQKLARKLQAEDGR